MVGFLLRAAISALGLWAASLLLPGISFESPGKLAIAAVLLGIVNAVVRPIAFILTLPITLVTLGLFLFVLNAAMVGLVARLVRDAAGDAGRAKDHRRGGGMVLIGMKVVQTASPLAMVANR